MLHEQQKFKIFILSIKIKLTLFGVKELHNILSNNI
jgi:hypothetical protein